MTLEDAAHNSAVVDAAAVVINDSTGADGHLRGHPAMAWASSPGHAEPVRPGRQLEPPGRDHPVVDWGDGTPATAWTTGTTISHVYTGRQLHAEVTITDEAHNAAQVATSAVAVNVDSAAPVVRLLLPRAHKHSVRASRPCAAGPPTRPAPA